MRKPKETVSDVPKLMKEWDDEVNSAYGIFPQRLGSQSNTYAYWRCQYGHQWKAKISNRYHGRGCPECSKYLRTSFPEQAVYFCIKRIFPDAVNSYKIVFDSSMELDVYIPSLKTAIEYDGVAWHREETFDREKRKYSICQAEGIRLYRLKENAEHADVQGVADVIIVVPRVFSGTLEGYQALDEAIKKLLLKMVPDRAENYDVNTKRDRIAIYESFLTAQKRSSLEKEYPSLAAQWHPEKNGTLKPSMVLSHSNYKAWWIGDCGHEWITPVAVRTRGNGCPYCSGKTVLKGFNDLKTLFPDIARSWHPCKNDDKTPDMFTAGSGYRAYWLCDVCGQEWQAQINNRTGRKGGCPYCAHIKPIEGKNDLATVCPELMKEWHYAKNSNVDPTKLLPNSNKKVWWKCAQCGLEYQAIISNRQKGTGCKRCAGQVLIPGENDLATLYPQLAKEWDYETNHISPREVFASSNKKYYWTCALGHRWQAAPNSRKDKGCPYCSGNKVLKGFNDIQTTYPEIAKEWHPTKNQGLEPTEVSKGYTKKVWFLCSECHNAYESFIGNKIKGFGKCPVCSPRKTRAKCVVQIETGRRFKTLKEAALSVGKQDIRLIQMCCVGRVSTAYGYHWEYQELGSV